MYTQFCKCLKIQPHRAFAEVESLSKLGYQVCRFFQACGHLAGMALIRRFGFGTLDFGRWIPLVTKVFT